MSIEQMTEEQSEQMLATHSPGGEPVQFAQPTPTDPILTIFDEANVPVVVVKRNGTVEITEGVELDEASQRFWDGVTEVARRMGVPI